MKRVVIPFIGLSLLVACNNLPPQEFRAGQGSGTVLFATGTDLDNVAQPDTADSLEVSSETGVEIPVIRLINNEGFRFGDAPSTGEFYLPPTMIEYFDYNCEYCREHALSERPWIDAEFVATKRINIERIFVPLTEWGRIMDVAAICADMQGKYKEVDQYLLTETPANETTMNADLRKLGLDMKKLAACKETSYLMNSREPYMPDNKTAIDRVPAFSIGKTSWKGILPASQMREKIEEGLKAK